MNASDSASTALLTLHVGIIDRISGREQSTGNLVGEHIHNDESQRWLASRRVSFGGDNRLPVAPVRLIKKSKSLLSSLSRASVYVGWTIESGASPNTDENRYG
jgi:hypothetical protein